MNNYLSKPEKVSMTRIMLLVDLLDQVIADYQKAKGVDAEFMKDLRTCRTWGKKAIKRRYDFLDLDAAKDFTRHIHHMDIIFVPNDKAQHYYKIVQDMAGAICMNADDFAKLYSGFIPKTCGKCHKKAWKKCLIREIFRKYGVETVNNNAKNCPYSYLEAGIDLEEWAKEWAKANGMKYDSENMWESDGEVHETPEEAAV
ncbi:DUF5651 domain-containing protein [Selenomonas sp. AB3002]|jgi:hypothetical protein|uniref:DUF5651 domain-containing protein n=1 Tax=Selenomonas sp. AB3002 TaxID=1392502 RepID=UPI0004964788